MIIINFKNYKSGVKVLELAKKIEKYLPNAIVAVPAINLKEIVEKTKLKAYAQHLDHGASDKTTGFTVPKSVKSIGVKGTLLNHSEHRLKEDVIEKTIKAINKSKLKIILCIKSVKEAKKYKKFNVFAMAFEDSKLIGTGKSITKYNTNKLKKFVSLLKNAKTIPLCGSGISSKEDYLEALRLGYKGVLISSAIANSRNPGKLLKEIKT